MAGGVAQAGTHPPAHRPVRCLLVFQLHRAIACGLPARPVKRSANSGLKIIAPPPVPADGIQGYADNALLIGLIVLVVVAASACAVDARPALSIFYRTRAGA